MPSQDVSDHDHPRKKVQQNQNFIEAVNCNVENYVKKSINSTKIINELLNN